MVVEKDDQPKTTGNTVVFLILDVSDLLLLCFCAKRLYSHVRVKEKYAPLLVFYVVLVVFLGLRVSFYLDPWVDYSSDVYEALYILPTLLIVSAASLISYIWTEIASQMLAHPTLPFYFTTTTISRLLLCFNLFGYSLYICTFLILMKVNSDSNRYIKYTRAEECCMCALMGAWQLFIGFKVEAVYRSLVSKQPKRVISSQIFIVKYMISGFFFARTLVSIFLLTFVHPKDMTVTTRTVLVFCYYFLLEFVLLTGMVVAINSPNTHTRGNTTMLPASESPASYIPIPYSSTIDSY